MPIDQSWPLEKVFEETEREQLFAEPILGRNDSPWLALRKGVVKKIKSAIGKSVYQAHEGAGLTPRGVFITEILDQRREYITVKNVSKWPGAKLKIKKEIVKVVKKDVVYPVLFGKEVSRWKVSQNKVYFTIILYDPATGKIFDEKFVKINYPNAYAYYYNFKDTLINAANYKQYGRGKPFYFIHRMGKQIFSPFKVVWGEVGTEITAAVTSQASVLEQKLLLPDYTCVYIPLRNEDEAFYICAILNSTLSRLVTSYIHLHPDPHVLEYLRVEKYNPENETHKQLTVLSREAHNAAARDNKDRLYEIENEIDVCVAKLYGLSQRDLDYIKMQFSEK